MIHILSIVLDGIDFLPRQLETFEQLKTPWCWHIIEGAAANTGSTSWCQPQEPRLSTDGSAEWLNAHAQHPSIRLYRKQWWPGGKDEMVSAPLKAMALARAGTLLEVDIDELWTPDQIQKIHSLLSQPMYNRLYCACRYYVGKNIVVLPENDPVNNIWLRAWSYTPGDTWVSHEPPVLKQQKQGVAFPCDEAIKLGLVFEHFSYFYEHQVAYKGAFYGYPDAVKHWRRLQDNTKFPCALTDFFPWAKPGAMATLVK